MQSMSPSAQLQAITEGARVAESTRLTAVSAKRGWLKLILPAGCVMLIVVLYTLQKASGIPVFDVMAQGASCTTEKDEDGQEVKKNCDLEKRHSGASLGLARALVMFLLVFLIYYIYTLFADGFGTGLTGTVPGLEKNMASDVLKPNTDYLKRDLSAVEQAPETVLYPKGTMDAAVTSESGESAAFLAMMNNGSSNDIRSGMDGADGGDDDREIASSFLNNSVGGVAADSQGDGGLLTPREVPISQ